MKAYFVFEYLYFLGSSSELYPALVAPLWPHQLQVTFLGTLHIALCQLLGSPAHCTTFGNRVIPCQHKEKKGQRQK